MIYSMAKKLGQSEQYVRDNYTATELIERTMFESRQNYVDRETMPKYDKDGKLTN